MSTLTILDWLHFEFLTGKYDKIYGLSSSSACLYGIAYRYVTLKCLQWTVWMLSCSPTVCLFPNIINCLELSMSWHQPYHLKYWQSWHQTFIDWVHIVYSNSVLPILSVPSVTDVFQCLVQSSRSKILCLDFLHPKEPHAQHSIRWHDRSFITFRGTFLSWRYVFKERDYSRRENNQLWLCRWSWAFASIKMT